MLKHREHICQGLSTTSRRYTNDVSASHCCRPYLCGDCMEFQGCRILGRNGPMYLKILEPRVTMTNYIISVKTKSNQPVATIAKGDQKKIVVCVWLLLLIPISYQQAKLENQSLSQLKSWCASFMKASTKAIVQRLLL